MIEQKMIEKFKRDLNVLEKNFKVRKHVEKGDLDSLESMINWWYLNARSSEMENTKDSIKTIKEVDKILIEVGTALSEAPFNCKGSKKIEISKSYKLIIDSLLKCVDMFMEILYWYDNLYLNSTNIREITMKIMKNREEFPPDIIKGWEYLEKDWEKFDKLNINETESILAFLEAFIILPKFNYLNADSFEKWKEISSKTEAIKMIIEKIKKEFKEELKMFEFINTSLKESVWSKLDSKPKEIIN